MPRLNYCLGWDGHDHVTRSRITVEPIPTCPECGQELWPNRWYLEDPLELCVPCLKRLQRETPERCGECEDNERYYDFVAHLSSEDAYRFHEYVFQG